MIAKCCEPKGVDWDTHLPYLLYAYRVSAQESTRESPFYLTCGRDTRIPSATVLTPQRNPHSIGIDDYKSELVAHLSEAWQGARENIKDAQVKQKRQYDRRTRKADVKPGARVMVYMPAAVQGKKRKVARPYYGPYRVLSVTPTNAEVREVDEPTANPIFVALGRLCLCYPEQENTTWMGRQPRRRKANVSREPKLSGPSVADSPPVRTVGPVTRSMARQNAT